MYMMDIYGNELKVCKCCVRLLKNEKVLLRRMFKRMINLYELMMLYMNRDNEKSNEKMSKEVKLKLYKEFMNDYDDGLKIEDIFMNKYREVFRDYY